MFSIQTASTGPSKIIHFRSGVLKDACSRNILARTPKIDMIQTRHTQNHGIETMLSYNLEWSVSVEVVPIIRKLRLTGMQLPEKIQRELRRFERRHFVG
jgi:hypothetical protein